MEGVLLPMSYSYSKFLFYSSFSMLISAIIAIIMNDTAVTTYFILLFLTSINYWRRPEYGFRRNIDLFCRFVFLSMFLSVSFFYLIEQILVYYRSLKWIAFHMSIHIYVSLSALFIVFN